MRKRLFRAAWVAGSCFALCPQALIVANDPSVPVAVLPSCDDASTDPWVVDLRTRVLEYDGLTRYAVEQFGPPIACHGDVQSVFEGMKFGVLELSFANRAKLSVETMPPESSRVTLISPDGFENQEEARRRLADYVEGIGVEIDWSQPETTAENGDTVQVFWSDDSGMNASVELVFEGRVLRRLRFSLAL